MITLDEADFTRALKGLAEGLGVKLEPGRAGRYFKVLKDLPLAPLLWAIDQLEIEWEHSRLPTPGVIRRMACERYPRPEGEERQIWGPSWKDAEGHWFTRKAGGFDLPEDRGAFVPPGPYSRRAFALIKKLAEPMGKVDKRRDHQSLLAEISALHEIRPTGGWDDCYQELAELWASKGYLGPAGAGEV